MTRFVPAARAALLVLACAPAVAGAYGFEDVSKRAQQLAARSYQPPESGPAALGKIDYDAYRDIRFRPERALWHGKHPFEVQFFHQGFLFQQAVRINVVGAQGVRPLKFDPASFSYGRNAFDPKDLRKLGYAGLRIHYPLHRADYKDEVAVFLGASYLRGIGRNQGYGLSARGLAVDTGLPSGEEFPTFREFWLEWPAPGASELVVFALLDSRRVTGAYRFVIRPGDATVMDVRARLFLRGAVGKLGLAPLTSMYFFGENQPAAHEDYRPEVHDSDGLLVASGSGEWLWRPLVNPRRLLVTSFAQQQAPRGFGLLQRDRAFARYEDLESRFERRPSAWVEPIGAWGPGRVELVQIPTGDEFNDNIVAFWVPDRAPALGTPVEIAYRLSWQLGDVGPLGRVLQTRRGAAGDDVTRFIVDFGGGALDRLPRDASAALEAWCGAGGELLEHRAYRNEATGGWRAVLHVRRKEKDEPLELRALLRGPDGPVSETWSYVWPIQ